MTIQNRMAYITALNINLFLGSLHRASHFVRHILCVTRNTNEAASLCGGEWVGGVTYSCTALYLPFNWANTLSYTSVFLCFFVLVNIKLRVNSLELVITSTMSLISQSCHLRPDRFPLPLFCWCGVSCADDWEEQPYIPRAPAVSMSLLFNRDFFSLDSSNRVTSSSGSSICSSTEGQQFRQYPTF